MKRWSAESSVLAPLIAAVPPDVEWAGFGNAFYAAVNGVPTTTALYRVSHPKKMFKTVVVERERLVVSLVGDAVKPWSYAARCTDAELEHSKPIAAGACWQVGLTHLKDGLLTPAVPANWDSAILTVVRMRLSDAGLDGAPQLALLRHRWGRAVLAASPEAIVFGGQHEWRDEWWQEKEPEIRYA